MVSSLINTSEIATDIRNITAQERTYRTKLQKKFGEDDACDKLTQLFTSIGYNIEFNKSNNYFIVAIDPHFKIYGNIKKQSVEVGVHYTYNGVSCTTEQAGIPSCMTDHPVSCGFIKLERETIERYTPLFLDLITRGKAMSEKYDELMKIQKQAELLDALVKQQMETLGIDNVEVLYDSDSNFFIQKTKMGIRLKTQIDFSNYMDVCAQFAQAFSRFPHITQQLDALNIYLGSRYELHESNLQNPHYINPLNYSPNDIKMVYANKVQHTHSIEGVDPALAEILNRWQFQYVYHEDTADVEIILTDYLSLIRKDDLISFRLQLETPINIRNNKSDIDDAHFKRLLYLIALASQNGGLRTSLNQCIDAISVDEVLGTFLTYLFPSGMKLYLGLRSSYIKTESRLVIDIPKYPCSRLIDYIYTIVVNINEFIAIKNVWEQKSEEESVFILMMQDKEWRLVK